MELSEITNQDRQDEETVLRLVSNHYEVLKDIYHWL